jgi:hypothetical protein
MLRLERRRLCTRPSFPCDGSLDGTALSSKRFLCRMALPSIGKVREQRSTAGARPIPRSRRDVQSARRTVRAAMIIRRNADRIAAVKVQSIVGTWKLVSAVARDRNGNTLPDPYGGKAMGRVMFNAEGRMMAVTCDGRRDLPPGAKREYSSYIGTYRFDGSRLVTRVDGASDPSRVGTDQVRGVRFDGQLMVLSPPPRQTDSGEKFRELTWERIATDEDRDPS